MGVFFYIQKGLPIRAGGGIAYEHLLKEQRDAQNLVSNGGADRKADKRKRHSVMGVFFTCKRDA